jgi:hypothetical protein
MCHDRKPERLGNLNRHIERRDTRTAARIEADPHLDAEYEIAVLLGDAEAFAQIEQPEIGAFSNHQRRAEGIDAGKGDIEISKDAQRRRFDDVPPKSMEVARSGTPGVHKCGRAAASRHGFDFDPHRCAAPVYVAVKVYQPGHDEQAGNVANRNARGGCEIRANCCDPSSHEMDVDSTIQSLRRVDDTATFEQQIRQFGFLLPLRLKCVGNARRPNGEKLLEQGQAKVSPLSRSSL